MFLFKRKRREHDILRLVSVTDRILLECRGTTFHTIVEDIYPGRLCVAVPEDPEGGRLFFTGDSITVSAPEPRGLRIFSGRVTDFERENIPLMVIGDLKYIGFSEQREAPRLKKRMIIRYRLIRENRTRGRWYGAITKEISSSGCSFTAERYEQISEGNELEIDMALPGQELFTITARVSALRLPISSEQSDTEVATSYISISEDDRERIARYVERAISDFKFERRTRERICLEPPLRVKCNMMHFDQVPLMTGFADDLSLGGMCLLLRNADDVIQGSIMTLEVDLPHRSVTITCEVAWIEPGCSGNGSRRLGVKFASTAEPGFQALKGYFFMVRTA